MDERQQLQQAVLDAVNKLMAATGAHAFCGTIGGTTPPLYVAFGGRAQIIALLADQAANSG